MSTTQIVQRTQGTIDVDIIDVARNQLVWEGAAEGRVTDSTRNNLQETADRAITDIFAQFP
jgi:predicted rRNA methylase YqxC with S4 and FtsJ domains